MRHSKLIIVKKCKNKAIIIFATLLLLGSSSCKKFLTVTPVTNISDVQFFTNELAFKEALNGVYVRMAENNSYGRSLSYGVTDVLAGMYLGGANVLPTSYQAVFSGTYVSGNATALGLTEPIWSHGYNVLANLNRLIEALDEVNPAIFTGDNYNILRGEAYGLRAMLHFDLLRLFGKSTRAGGMAEPSIPYRTKYNNEVSPRLTGAEVMEKINADLAVADEMLQNDPIRTRIQPSTDDLYLVIGSRRLRFNYYAAKGLQARVSLWADDKPAALAAAEEVIAAVGNNHFSWTSNGAFTAADAERDRILSMENMFTVYVPLLSTNYLLLLEPQGTNASFNIDLARVNLQYENSIIDLRAQWLIRTSQVNQKLYFSKLYQPENMNVNYAKRIPVMRIPEMFYIAAECLIDSDPEKAISYVNAVRQRRLLPALATSLNAATIQDEIRKEYWKEFPLEGQMFYYYKRKGATAVPGVSGTFSQDRYVLPLPVSEVEFGG